MNTLTKVCDLEVGHRIKWNNLTMVVGEIHPSYVIIYKITARPPHGRIQLSKFSHKWGDLQNRVEVIYDTRYGKYTGLDSKV